MKDFEIPYRELKEQKAIANVLSSLDDKIALNQRINDNLILN
ncbi:restriction endonuclease subunit S [Petrimonas sp.]